MFLVRTRRLACALQRLSKPITKFESLLLEVTFLLHDLSFFPLAVLICIIAFFLFCISMEQKHCESSKIILLNVSLLKTLLIHP